MLDLTKSNSSLYCVFLGSNMNLECHIQLINLSFKCLCVLLVYHCKLTDSSGYWQLLHALHAPKSLNMYFLHRLLALLTCARYAAVSYTFHTQPVSYCKPMQDHITHLVNHQCSCFQALTQLSASDRKLPLFLH